MPKSQSRYMPLFLRHNAHMLQYAASNATRMAPTRTFASQNQVKTKAPGMPPTSPEAIRHPVILEAPHDRNVFYHYDERTGRHFYVVGTNHGDESMYYLARSVIRAVRARSVVVEMRPAQVKHYTPSSLHEIKPSYMFSGVEFLGAVHEAMLLGADVVCGDMEKGRGFLQRRWDGVRMSLFTLIYGFKNMRSIKAAGTMQDEVQSVRRFDDDLRRSWPSLYNSIAGLRREHLAQAMMHSRGKVVVAVVGLAHAGPIVDLLASAPLDADFKNTRLKYNIQNSVLVKTWVGPDDAQ